MATTDELTWVYAADVFKVDKTTDGDRMVHGKAAGPELDLDEQICDPAWLATALPDWMRWGNIRAMHQPIAVGLGKNLTALDGGGWDLSAEIVDADAKMKLDKQIYKGFSIGIKGARVVPDANARKGRIVGGVIAEVSLVDRPCNPTAVLSLVKSAGIATIPDDPESPELLVPLDGHGDVLQPQEPTADELAAYDEITKGFIDFLRGPKPKKAGKAKRDQGGKFSHTDTRDKALKSREARAAAAEARAKLRDAASKARDADTHRAITENQLSTEALSDAQHARLAGRGDEAAEHATTAAVHAHDSAHRGRVAHEVRAIGKMLTDQTLNKGAGTDVEEVWTDEEVIVWEADLADILGELLDDLEVTEPDEGAAPRGYTDMDDGALVTVALAAVRELSTRGENDLIKSVLPDDLRRLPDRPRTSRRQPVVIERVEKAASGDREDPYTIIDELNKAAKATQQAHEAELQILRARVTEVEDTLTKTVAPDAMAPVLVVQSPKPSGAVEIEASRAERLRRDAERMSDPVAQRAALAYANTLGGGHPTT